MPGCLFGVRFDDSSFVPVPGVSQPLGLFLDRSTRSLRFRILDGVASERPPDSKNRDGRPANQKQLRAAKDANRMKFRFKTSAPFAFFEATFPPSAPPLLHDPAESK